MLTETPMLTGSYDHRLVALSVLIAICASYAALDLAGRVTAARGRAFMFWLIGGAGAMGLGIWSTYYIGMLAFRLPVPVSYDWPTVMLSLRVAILASAVALYVVSCKVMSLWRAVAGSMVMGAGIAAMHYIGMEAMRSTAMRHYDARLVALSIALAIGISFVAFRLAFLARDEKKGASLRKIVSATVMGLAILAMHYTGMAAASFTADGTAPDMSHAIEHHDVRSGGHHDRHDGDPLACLSDFRIRSPLSPRFWNWNPRNSVTGCYTKGVWRGLSARRWTDESWNAISPARGSSATPPAKNSSPVPSPIDTSSPKIEILSSPYFSE